MISLIWAMSQNKVIGLNNQLPWHYVSDLQYFKKVTLNHQVLMGYNTYLSIKKISDKLLPNRKCLVLYPEPIEDKYVEIVSDLDTFIRKSKDTDEEIFIIGGASVYQQLLPYAKYLYVTLIEKDYDGDTYFDVDFTKYEKISEEVITDQGDTLKMMKWRLK